MGLADAPLVEYYAKRAQEYERIYEKPERQRDLAALRDLFRGTLAGHNVLEIACGTGYWTEVIARTARSILATDLNDEVLKIARTKKYSGAAVEFRNLDAFKLEGLAGKQFTAGLAAAWWSHLRRSELKAFLAQFHRALSPGALVVFMDNRFVPGSNTPISRTDAGGNTYQRRRLASGEEHEVLKNFPAQPEVEEVLAGLAADVRWIELEYYWFLTYRTLNH